MENETLKKMVAPVIDEALIGEVMMLAGKHIHLITGWVCAYRAAAQVPACDCDALRKGLEVMFRRFISMRRRKQTITHKILQDMAKSEVAKLKELEK